MITLRKPIAHLKRQETTHTAHLDRFHPPSVKLGVYHCWVPQEEGYWSRWDDVDAIESAGMVYFNKCCPSPLRPIAVWITAPAFLSFYHSRPKKHTIALQSCSRITPTTRGGGHWG
jgi:hypothetical protein